MKKQKALCFKCESLQSVSFKTRDVGFLDGSGGIVEDVLVGVCDNCDSVILTCPESSDKIKQSIDSKGE